MLAPLPAPAACLHPGDHLPPRFQATLDEVLPQLAFGDPATAGTARAGPRAAGRTKKKGQAGTAGSGLHASEGGVKKQKKGKTPGEGAGAVGKRTTGKSKSRQERGGSGGSGKKGEGEAGKHKQQRDGTGRGKEEQQDSPQASGTTSASGGESCVDAVTCCG